MSETTPPPTPEDAGSPMEEVYCWLNADRVCGPDCMAYLPFSEVSRCRLLHSAALLTRGVSELTRRKAS